MSLSDHPMLRTLITCLTLFALLLHASLGCCWHHEHAPYLDGFFHNHLGESAHQHGSHSVDHSADHAVGSTATTAPGHGAIGVSSEQPLSSSGSPCQHPHGDCDHAGCTYLTAPLVKVPAPADETASWGELPAPGSTCPTLAAAQASQHRYGGDDGMSDIARSVLSVTQVWLL